MFKNIKKEDLFDILISVLDSDTSPVVICDTEDIIIYMNPSAIENYKKRGGKELLGTSLLKCHNQNSAKLIKDVTDWFKKSPLNNKVHTFYNKEQNKDVYMIALRDGDGSFIGYYEKHEYRNADSSAFYDIKTAD